MPRKFIGLTVSAWLLAVTLAPSEAGLFGNRGGFFGLGLLERASCSGSHGARANYASCSSGAQPMLLVPAYDQAPIQPRYSVPADVARPMGAPAPE